MRSIPLWGKLLGGIGVVAAACVGLSFVPTGQVAYAPIAPIDMSGKVTIDGRATEPLQGRIYLVGVTERRVNMLQRLLLDAGDPDIDFGPEPTGGPKDGPAPRDVTSMSEAKRVAAGVSFDLAQPGSVTWSGAGATVASVTPGTPAAASLRAGDIIVRVNGVDVDTSVEAGNLINPLAPGSAVKLGVQRAGEAVQPTVRTLPVPAGEADATHRSRIGVALETIGLKVALPREVQIDSGEVVGPSAGLAFALYIYDLLEPVDLLHGRHVVVSGALAPDGQVVAVGRVRQKAISAQAANHDLLVVPVANYAEAKRAAAEACGDARACLRVVPVRTVRQAVALLRLEDAALDAAIGAAGGAGAAAGAGA